MTELISISYEYIKVKRKLHSFIHSCIGDTVYKRHETAKNKLGQQVSKSMFV
jgi:hypothetical protein